MRQFIWQKSANLSVKQQTHWVARYTLPVIAKRRGRHDSARHGRLWRSRVRTMAALNSLLTWVVKHDLLGANPRIKLDRVEVPEPKPGGVKRDQIDAVLAAIPRDQLRDQLLFRLLAETGLRIGEVL